MATAGCGLGAAVPELLDWLCLNTSETELPSGFAAQMRSKVEVWTPGKLTQPLAGGPEPEPEFAGELPPSTAKPAWEEPAAEAEARRPAAGGGEAVSGLWQLLLGWAGRPVNGGGAGGLTEEEVSLECNTARELGAACGVSQPTVVAEAASTGGESWEDDVMEPVTAESFEEDEFMVLQSIYGGQSPPQFFVLAAECDSATPARPPPISSDSSGCPPQRMTARCARLTAELSLGHGSGSMRRP